ncbi:MAG: hypothetical protein ACOYKZ_07160 [Chlamydiia bacterium]
MITTGSIGTISIVGSRFSLEAEYAIRLKDGERRLVKPDDECLYVLHQFVPRDAWRDIVLSEEELAPLRVRFAHVTQERANSVIQQIFSRGVDDSSWVSLKDDRWCSIQ